jgi:phytoene dehydrogenase-like protein
VKDKKKIIIVGGGVAGLSAGIYAQMNGFDSQIVEMHSIAGGLCTAWHRKEYKFDYSIQWLVGSKYGVFHNVYRDTDILNDGIEIINPDVHLKLINPQAEDFVIYTSIDKWENYLLEKAPEDTHAIRKMCRDMRRCTKLESFDLAPSLRKPFHYIRALFRSYPTLLTILKYKNLRSEDYFNLLNIKNEWLHTSLHGIYGNANFSIIPFLLILSWYAQGNSGYPKGGSLAVAERMHQRYTKLGGNILFKKRVAEIMVENSRAKGVLLEDGTRIEGDYVISAADGYHTIFNLLKGKYFSSNIKKAYENWEPFNAFVQVSFGVNAGLKTDVPVQWVLAKGKEIGKTKLRLGYRILNYNFDKTMAPEGKSCIIIRFESPWEIWENLSEEEYREEKKRIEKAALQLLEEHYPGTSALVEVCDIATPQTTVRYTGAWKGSYEGFLPSPKNITQQLSLTLPGLSRFYMVGQWLFPGGGIPPSVLSGKWALQMICKEEKRKFTNQ